MKRIAVAAGIIEDATGRVLLAQRPFGKHLGGYWEFPGGKIESGEDGFSALRRELLEELNLEVGFVKTLGVFPHNYEWGVVELHVFVVTPLNEPRLSTEVMAIKWLAPGLIKASDLAPADVKPLEEYLNSRPTAG